MTERIMTVDHIDELNRVRTALFAVASMLVQCDTMPARGLCGVADILSAHVEALDQLAKAVEADYQARLDQERQDRSGHAIERTSGSSMRTTDSDTLTG
ncbi:MAG: hypothetical protein KFB96_03345 [Thiocapsa sp.]|uniref:hypothetical protein n=1 Tax=Thiocapsa sp. TaxID=2024551 RepID=UPI001BCED27D|nr:hypothetical protein [Thiocapsa sp.]QVL49556.1 MAG: hypothetical protein KFB96_03345 [Thiocapsa sp.]